MRRVLNTHRRYAIRAALLILLVAFLTTTSARLKADTSMCGGGSVTLPFTDVPAANVFFCSIASAFYSGLTNGTTPTTYAPGAAAREDTVKAEMGVV